MLSNLVASLDTPAVTGSLLVFAAVLLFALAAFVVAYAAYFLVRLYVGRRDAYAADSNDCFDEQAIVENASVWMLSWASAVYVTLLRIVGTGQSLAAVAVNNYVAVGAFALSWAAALLINAYHPQLFLAWHYLQACFVGPIVRPTLLPVVNIAGLVIDAVSPVYNYLLVQLPRTAALYGVNDVLACGFTAIEAFMVAISNATVAFAEAFATWIGSPGGAGNRLLLSTTPDYTAYGAALGVAIRSVQTFLVCACASLSLLSEPFYVSFSFTNTPWPAFVNSTANVPLVVIQDLTSPWVRGVDEYNAQGKTFNRAVVEAWRPSLNRTIDTSGASFFNALRVADNWFVNYYLFFVSELKQALAETAASDRDRALFFGTDDVTFQFPPPPERTVSCLYNPIWAGVTVAVKLPQNWITQVDRVFTTYDGQLIWRLDEVWDLVNGQMTCFGGIVDWLAQWLDSSAEFLIGSNTACRAVVSLDQIINDPALAPCALKLVGDAMRNLAGVVVNAVAAGLSAVENGLELAIGNAYTWAFRAYEASLPPGERPCRDPASVAPEFASFCQVPDSKFVFFDYWQFYWGDRRAPAQPSAAGAVNEFNATLKFVTAGVENLAAITDEVCGEQFCSGLICLLRGFWRLAQALLLLVIDTLTHFVLAFTAPQTLQLRPAIEDVFAAVFRLSCCAEAILDAIPPPTNDFTDPVNFFVCLGNVPKVVVGAVNDVLRAGVDLFSGLYLTLYEGSVPDFDATVNKTTYDIVAAITLANNATFDSICLLSVVIPDDAKCPEDASLSARLALTDTLTVVSRWAVTVITTALRVLAAIIEGGVAAATGDSGAVEMAVTNIVVTAVEGLIDFSIESLDALATVLECLASKSVGETIRDLATELKVLEPLIAEGAAEIANLVFLLVFGVLQAFFSFAAGQPNVSLLLEFFAQLIDLILCLFRSILPYEVLCMLFSFTCVLFPAGEVCQDSIGPSCPDNPIVLAICLVEESLCIFGVKPSSFCSHVCGPFSAASATECATETLICAADYGPTGTNSFVANAECCMAAAAAADAFSSEQGMCDCWPDAHRQGGCWQAVPQKPFACQQQQQQQQQQSVKVGDIFPEIHWPDAFSTPCLKTFAKFGDVQWPPMRHVVSAREQGNVTFPPRQGGGVPGNLEMCVDAFAAVALRRLAGERNTPLPEETFMMNAAFAAKIFSRALHQAAATTETAAATAAAAGRFTGDNLSGWMASKSFAAFAQTFKDIAAAPVRPALSPQDPQCNPQTPAFFAAVAGIQRAAVRVQNAAARRNVTIGSVAHFTTAAMRQAIGGFASFRDRVRTEKAAFFAQVPSGAADIRVPLASLAALSGMLPGAKVPAAPTAAAATASELFVSQRISWLARATDRLYNVARGRSVTAKRVAPADVGRTQELFSNYVCPPTQSVCLECSTVDRLIGDLEVVGAAWKGYYEDRLPARVAAFERGINNTVRDPIGTDTFLTCPKTIPFIWNRVATVQWPWLWNFTAFFASIDPDGTTFPGGSVPANQPYTGTLVPVQEANANLVGRESTQLVWLSLAPASFVEWSVTAAETVAYVVTAPFAGGTNSVAVNFLTRYVLCDYENVLARTANSLGLGTFDGFFIAGLALFVVLPFVIICFFPACAPGWLLAAVFGVLVTYPLGMALSFGGSPLCFLPSVFSPFPGVPEGFGGDVYELVSETFPPGAPIPVVLVEASSPAATALYASCTGPVPPINSCARTAGFLDGFDNIFYTLGQLAPSLNQQLADSPLLQNACPELAALAATYLPENVQASGRAEAMAVCNRILFLDVFGALLLVAVYVAVGVAGVYIIGGVVWLYFALLLATAAAIHEIAVQIDCAMVYGAKDARGQKIKTQ